MVTFFTITSGGSARIALFDTKITVKEGEASIETGGKVCLGGGTDNICTLLLAVIDELLDFQTVGPPPQHKMAPATVAKLNAYKEKIKALFKESP